VSFGEGTDHRKDCWAEKEKGMKRPRPGQKAGTTHQGKRVKRKKRVLPRLRECNDLKTPGGEGSIRRAENIPKGKETSAKHRPVLPAREQGEEGEWVSKGGDIVGEGELGEKKKKTNDGAVDVNDPSRDLRSL